MLWFLEEVLTKFIPTILGYRVIQSKISGVLILPSGKNPGSIMKDRKELGTNPNFCHVCSNPACCGTASILPEGLAEPILVVSGKDHCFFNSEQTLKENV